MPIFLACHTVTTLCACSRRHRHAPAGQLILGEKGKVFKCDLYGERGIWGCRRDKLKIFLLFLILLTTDAMHCLHGDDPDLAPGHREDVAYAEVGHQREPLRADPHSQGLAYISE